MANVTAEEAQKWLIDEIAQRLGVEPTEVPADQYFDELDLDSTQALIIAGEMESWLGFELGTTALWYHPTIEALAAHIAEECAARSAAA
ncbi:acyl carrier protein [Streptomyces sp. NBC_00322]|jgi:acyl carrier protein|uniref:acyl carrier protein n=1 Tax=unclassified Streptomyces TaxID=2593676 RepID=UPI002254F57C|nr:MULTISPECIES: acyl carrier protein [unclassified Streptomyces]MCX4582486.1 acyl carrier protein [Streptomyces sp. NBC_01481]WSY69973.1 acyl carrier protein [Streptomyces sp. NBC_00885]WSY77389.1 acyl carrier protein [Streptomyces sp. NBC_00879]HET6355679.1 acyl carrier protein [Streptomyces sp.]